jgi:hypothetical protein
MALPVDSRLGQPLAGETNVLRFRRNKFLAPLCAQCRASMAINRCEPDLDNSATLVATYHCTECGLRDRTKIQ